MNWGRQLKEHAEAGDISVSYFTSERLLSLNTKAKHPFPPLSISMSSWMDDSLLFKMLLEEKLYMLLVTSVSVNATFVSHCSAKPFSQISVSVEQ